MFAIPNLLSLARLACLPVVLWLTYSRELRWLVLALAIFLLSVATDWADGYLARATGAVTRLGTFLDQAVDKIFILSILFVMAQRGLLPMWLVLLNLFREIVVSEFRGFASAQRRTVGANWMGKTKFGLQAGLIVIMYGYLVAGAAGFRMHAGEPAILWAALAITAISFIFAGRFLWQRRAELSEH